MTMTILTSAPRTTYRTVHCKNTDQVTLGSTSAWDNSIVSAVKANPFRSLMDIVSIGVAVSNLVAPENPFLEAGSVVLAVGYGAAAAINGINADHGKRSGKAAIGDLLTGAGLGVSLAGAGPLGLVGLGMVAFGNSVSTIADFKR